MKELPTDDEIIEACRIVTENGFALAPGQMIHPTEPQCCAFGAYVLVHDCNMDADFMRREVPEDEYTGHWIMLGAGFDTAFRNQAPITEALGFRRGYALGQKLREEGLIR